LVSEREKKKGRKGTRFLVLETWLVPVGRLPSRKGGEKKKKKNKKKHGVNGRAYS